MARGNNLKNVLGGKFRWGSSPCVTGVFRRRQVDAVDRHTLYKAIARKTQQRPAEGAAPHRPHRGAWSISTRSSISTSRRSAAPPRSNPAHLYRRVHADPRMVRGPARSQGRAATSPGGFSFKRQGRARCEGLPGRRRHQDRDALFCPMSTSPATPCKGKALQPAKTLEVLFKGKSIADVPGHDGRGSPPSSSRRCRAFAREDF